MSEKHLEETCRLDDEKLATLCLVRVAVRLLFVVWVASLSWAGVAVAHKGGQQILFAVLGAAIAVGVLFACGLRLPKKKKAAATMPDIQPMTKPPVQSFRR